MTLRSHEALNRESLVTGNGRNRGCEETQDPGYEIA